MTRFDAAVEIALKLIGLEELAGAFQHDIAAEIAPGTSPGAAAALKPKRVLSTMIALSSSTPNEPCQRP